MGLTTNIPSCYIPSPWRQQQQTCPSPPTRQTSSLPTKRTVRCPPPRPSTPPAMVSPCPIPTSPSVVARTDPSCSRTFTSSTSSRTLTASASPSVSSTPRVAELTASLSVRILSPICV